MNTLVLQSFKYAGLNIAYQILGSLVGALLFGPLMGIVPFIVINWILYKANSTYTHQSIKTILLIPFLVCLNTGIILAIISTISGSSNAFQSAEFQEFMQKENNIDSQELINQIGLFVQNPFLLCCLITFSSLIFGLPVIFYSISRYVRRKP